MILELTSIGRASSQLQRSPSEINNVARQLGIEPAMRLNGIDHLTEQDLRRVAEHFRNVGGTSTVKQPTINH